MKMIAQNTEGKIDNNLVLALKFTSFTNIFSSTLYAYLTINMWLKYNFQLNIICMYALQNHH